jgi:phosphoribosylanthranilate isomerase
MDRTRIKICGVRDIQTALACAECGADAVGFVFVRSSPRFIAPEEAFEIMSLLPPLVSTVGVFMNATLDAFMDMEEACPTTLSQLHGNEDEALARQCGPGVIKAVKFDEGTIAAELARWDAVDEVDAVMVDAPTPGEGVPFNWEKLAAAVENVEGGLSKPLFLAGGLTPENVAEAVRVVRPYAVDVSSGVEKTRGVKDVDLIARFCEGVRRGDTV